MLPFTQEKNIRTFSANVDPFSLEWHRDEKDRWVTVKGGVGWQLQIDEQLPMLLIVGGSYFIPKLEFHRILKGNYDLVVQIDE